VQTPQGFDYAALCAAYASCDPAGATDDAMMMEQAGHAVCVVDGDEKNRKLTTQADLVWMRAMMERVETRSGQGFDVHQLYEDEARKLMICGVEVASPLALRGHSDADVGLHALVDAMLGALGHGDIGQHFPPSDDRWKDVDSADFVAEAVRLMHASGGRLVNADITIIGEVPKIGPYREVMRARVAELLGVEEARVNIKATTTEKLGFTGRKEGLAAQALVNIETGGMK
jgi:2-C-methyl-D-erythritol 4-phosphate cytidylyltransferase/2-C-methyl-D-erythritol 2,4-cyclodiphosphate synthase